MVRMLTNRLRYTKRQLTRHALFYLGKIATDTPAIYPDFFCIGAPRAGTTWLYKRLSLHPDIFLPGLKELNFFNDPEPTVENFFPQSFFLQKRTFDLQQESHWRWYYLLFRHERHKIKGDITPAYMLLAKEKINIIKVRMPSLKIILLIRNPVERAWSNLRRLLWFHRGKKPQDLGSDNDIAKILFSAPILARGEYRTTIQNWETYFSTEQIKYVFFEDLFQSPRKYLDEICDFIGAASEKLPGKLDDHMKINQAPADTIPPGIYQELCRYYQPHIAFLENKFQRDLISWVSSESIKL